MDSKSCANLHLQFVTIFTVSENIGRKTVENVGSNTKEYVKFPIRTGPNLILFMDWNDDEEFIDSFALFIT